MAEQIKQLLKGNKEYFRVIFNDYFQPLFHLSLHYLEDRDEAKGVVQEAFIRLWEVRKDLKPDSNLRNFLFTLVKNNCLNILKRRQIILKHHEKIRWMEMHFQRESLARINSDYLELDELEAKIKNAIERLPKNCRIIFEMSRLQEFKNREIAEKMNISQKTVEAHLTKALKILRTELKDYLPVICIISELLQQS